MLVPGIAAGASQKCPPWHAGCGTGRPGLELSNLMCVGCPRVCEQLVRSMQCIMHSAWSGNTQTRCLLIWHGAAARRFSPGNCHISPPSLWTCGHAGMHGIMAVPLLACHHVMQHWMPVHTQPAAQQGHGPPHGGATQQVRQAVSAARHLSSMCNTGSTLYVHLLTTLALTRECDGPVSMQGRSYIDRPGTC